MNPQCYVCQGSAMLVEKKTGIELCLECEPFWEHAGRFLDYAIVKVRSIGIRHPQPKEFRDGDDQ